MRTTLSTDSQAKPSLNQRSNRTMKEATAKRLHYENREQLRVRLPDFMTAYSLARPLTTLSGVNPY